MLQQPAQQLSAAATAPAGLQVGQYAILGSSMDDALGEAYDKTARLLGLEASHPKFTLTNSSLQLDVAFTSLGAKGRRRRGLCCGGRGG